MKSCKFCPNCGHKVSVNAKFCGNCGYNFKRVNNNNSEMPTNKTQSTHKDTKTSAISDHIKRNNYHMILENPCKFYRKPTPSELKRIYNIDVNQSTINIQSHNDVTNPNFWRLVAFNTKHPIQHYFEQHAGWEFLKYFIYTVIFATCLEYYHLYLFGYYTHFFSFASWFNGILDVCFLTACYVMPTEHNCLLDNLKRSEEK